MHELRSREDAVMVGAGTVRRDDPELTVRLAAGRNPVRVVITHDGTLPPGARVLATARQTRTIVVADAATGAARRLLEAAAPSCSRWAGGGLPGALEALAGLGLLDVLCEGGPTLAGGAPRGRSDRSRGLLFVAPLIVGGAARRDLFAAPGPSLPSKAAWGACGTCSGAPSATTCCSAGNWSVDEKAD